MGIKMVSGFAGSVVLRFAFFKSVVQLLSHCQKIASYDSKNVLSRFGLLQVGCLSAGKAPAIVTCPAPAPNP
jgi:hypothetical protein